MAGPKAKYSKELAEKIFEIYATGKYTVRDVCAEVGINTDTFYDWQKKKPFFKDGIDNVHFQRLQNIGERALSGLMKSVDIYEYDEVRTDYETIKEPDPQNPGKFIRTAQVSNRTVTKKIVMPNAKLVEYALNNLRKEEFKTSANIDHTSGGDSFAFANFLMAADTQVFEQVPEEETDDEEPQPGENENKLPFTFG